MRFHCLFALAAFVAVAAATGHGANAQGLVTTHRVSAALANEAVAAAVVACAGKGYNVSAALVDSDGVRIATLRGDTAGVHTIDSAQDKAFTAVTMKSDTSAIAARAKTMSVGSILAKMPHLVASGGGIVLKIGDEVIGGIGVSGAPGGEKDEACARAGFDAIKDRLK